MNNSKEFICAKCNKSFSRKFNLERHVLKCNDGKTNTSIQEIEEIKEINDDELLILSNPDMILIFKQLRRLENKVLNNSNNEAKLNKKIEELKIELEEQQDNYECEKQELEEKYDSLEKEYSHSEMFKRKMEEECHEKYNKLHEQNEKLKLELEQLQERNKRLEEKNKQLEERNCELEENCVRMRMQNKKINLVKVNN